MSIDRAEWHWDDTEKAYRRNHGITGELTEEQEDEIWLLAANHIGLFWRWIVERGFASEETEEEECERVRTGQATGAESLIEYWDTQLVEEAIREDILPFVSEYYGKHLYFDDYIECCTDDDKKDLYCVISGEEDYARLKARIDAACERFRKTGALAPPKPAPAQSAPPKPAPAKPEGKQTLGQRLRGLFGSKK